MIFTVWTSQSDAALPSTLPKLPGSLENQPIIACFALMVARWSQCDVQGSEPQVRQDIEGRWRKGSNCSVKRPRSDWAHSPTACSRSSQQCWSWTCGRPPSKGVPLALGYLDGSWRDVRLWHL